MGVFEILWLVGVLGGYSLVAVQQRHEVDDASAGKYRTSRRQARREAVSSRVLGTIQLTSFRWTNTNTLVDSDWWARMTVTESALLLTPDLRLCVLVGVPLFLPSYRIPLAAIQSVERSAAPKRPWWYTSFGNTGVNAAIATDEGTCFIRMRWEAELQWVQGIVGTAV